MKYPLIIFGFILNINLYGQSAADYYYSAIYKMKKSDFKGADESFTKYIELDSTNSHAYFNRAKCKDRLYNYKGAMEDYDKSDELNPNSWANRNSIIERRKLARSGGTFKDFTTKGSTNPYDSKVYSEKGLEKEKEGNYPGAILEYNRAIELYTKNAGAYFGRGNSKYILKDFQGAKEDYTKAIEFNPKYAKAYYNKGNTEYILGDKANACTDWTKAAKLGVEEAKDIISKNCK